jgi:2'-5' RNA ligase
MEIRSFLAFELGEEIIKIISRSSRDLKKHLPDARWIKAGNIHLTVVFLGNVHSNDIAALGKEVKKVCRRHGPFKIFLNGLGMFGSQRSPRVIWIGLDGDIRQMGYFRNALNQHLKPYGVKREKRPFKPHLTLGRFKKGAGSSGSLNQILEEHKTIKSPELMLKELVLFKSDPTPAGAVYTRLDAWPMAG